MSAVPQSAGGVPGNEPAPANFVLRLLRGEVPQHAIGRTLGARLVSLDLEAGRLSMEFVGTDAFLNPAGTVQGGMLAAMLDDLTASLANATASGDEHCATLDLHTAFLRPARPGALQGAATVLRRGREIVQVAGELSQDGKTVATATATCMLRRAAR